MIVGVQAIPACFDGEQNRYNVPAEVLEVHLQSYDTLLSHPVHTDSGGHRAQNTAALDSGLAESCDSSRDGRSYTLQLRRGVGSAAGHELTAHDVKWSWERAFALNSWSARIARHCGVCTPDGIRVVQPYVVQFRLEDPTPQFAALLAAPFPPIHDLEAVRQHCPVGDPWGDVWLRSHTAGFGPFALEEVVVGEEATLLANMSCWRGVPRERSVLLRAVAPGFARAEALARGSIDMAADLPANAVMRLGEDPKVKIARLPPNREIVLRLDPAFAPFDQADVRKALAAALPFDAIERELGVAGGGQAPQREQDHRGARTLLREAGYGSGFRISLYVPADNADLQAVAQAIQIDAIRLNLKVVVEAIEPALFAREKAGRHLAVYLEERRRLTPRLSLDEIEALPQVETIVLAEPPGFFAARANVEGFVRRPDGRPRYSELRKT